MRLVLIISSLRSGGAERVLSGLANICADRGWSIRLVTVSGTDKDFYSLSPAVDRVAIDISGASANALVALSRNRQRMRALRLAVTSFEPDVAVVFGARTNVLALMALKGTGVPVVVSERTDPFALNIGFPWQQLRPWAYRRAAAVVAQTDRVAHKVISAWSLKNVPVIPNPLSQDLPPMEAVTADRQKTLLSVGRLGKEKGHDVLLDAWAALSPGFPDWRLRLAGEGPERSRLEAQAARLGLEDRVEFAGLVTPVWQEFLDAQVFVLPSRREGFPNALLEALACGCICVASDCDSGPAELLKGGVLGYLYKPNTAEELAGALKAALSQTVDPGHSAAREVRQQYAADTVTDRWTELLRQVGDR